MSEFNSDNVVLTNNPYDIDLSTGYNDGGYIPTSTVLMSADDWDKQYEN